MGGVGFSLPERQEITLENIAIKRLRSYFLLLYTISYEYHETKNGTDFSVPFLKNLKTKLDSVLLFQIRKQFYERFC